MTDFENGLVEVSLPCMRCGKPVVTRLDPKVALRSVAWVVICTDCEVDE